MIRGLHFLIKPPQAMLAGHEACMPGLDWNVQDYAGSRDDDGHSATLMNTLSCQMLMDL